MASDSTQSHTHREDEAISHETALIALDNLDDYARMTIGVDASGPREALKKYILQQERAALESFAASRPVAGALPVNMGYEPDGPVGMALSWLKSALACKAFVWDGDQHEYATKSLEDSERWLAQLRASTTKAGGAS